MLGSRNLMRMTKVVVIILLGILLVSGVACYDDYVAPASSSELQGQFAERLSELYPILTTPTSTYPAINFHILNISPPKYSPPQHAYPTFSPPDYHIPAYSPPEEPSSSGCRCYSYTYDRYVSCDVATAICNDGTCSVSQNRQGTCSHHGGVQTWLK